MVESLAFPLWGLAQFILLLLSIAIVPVVFPAWWDKNTNKLLVSLGMSAPALFLLLPDGACPRSEVSWFIRECF